jgi:3-hydroxyacyl-[acyl-carrier-protein] dehydratase
MSLEQILQLIPHRPPMLLIDEIVTLADQAVTCRKTFRPEEFFFQGHYPDFPLVPGVILLESCCQAGAVLVAKRLQDNAQSMVPVLTRVDNAKFKQMVRPGDTILLEAEVVDSIAQAIYLKGKIKRDDKVAVTFDFVCSMAQAPN